MYKEELLKLFYDAITNGDNIEKVKVTFKNGETIKLDFDRDDDDVDDEDDDDDDDEAEVEVKVEVKVESEAKNENNGTSHNTGQKVNVINR